MMGGVHSIRRVLCLCSGCRRRLNGGARCPTPLRAPARPDATRIARACHGRQMHLRGRSTTRQVCDRIAAEVKAGTQTVIRKATVE